RLELTGGTRAVMDYRRAKLLAAGATDAQLAAHDALVDTLVEEERALGHQGRNRAVLAGAYRGQSECRGRYYVGAWLCGCCSRGQERRGGRGGAGRRGGACDRRG